MRRDGKHTTNLPSSVTVLHQKAADELAGTSAGSSKKEEQTAEAGAGDEDEACHAVKVSDIMTLDDLNNYQSLQEADGVLQHSPLGKALDLELVCAAGLRSLEKKLELLLWQVFLEKSCGGSSVQINLLDKKDQVSVKVPVPDDLCLPFAGTVRLQKPAGKTHFKLCSAFGLTFYVCSPGCDLLSQDVAVAAWSSKTVTKLDQAFFSEKTLTFFVEAALNPRMSPLMKAGSKYRSLIDVELALLPSKADCTNVDCNLPLSVGKLLYIVHT